MRNIKKTITFASVSDLKLHIMEKIKVSQDFLYKYLLEHGVTMSCIAREMNVSVNLVASCFKHQKDIYGQPRYFTAKALPKLNAALGILSEKIHDCFITFGSEQTFTNSRGTTYDPGVVDAMKELSQYFNIILLTFNVLGWSKAKKEAVLCSPSSKAYGQISAADVNRINAELLAVSGYLGGIEVLTDAKDVTLNGE